MFITVLICSSWTFYLSCFIQWGVVSPTLNPSSWRAAPGRLCGVVFYIPFAPNLEHRADFSVSWSFTDGRTSWTSGRPVARPLLKHRTTQTQNKRIHTLNIHVLIEIRTHDPGFRASEDSTCLRALGYRDRRLLYTFTNIPHIWNRFSREVIRVLPKWIEMSVLCLRTGTCPQDS
jgi:hypothetical protein